MSCCRFSRSSRSTSRARRRRRADADLFQIDRATGRQSGGWTNKLIWGDNKLVLASLKNGPLRREIENAGGLKLVYIDPPFDVGADFSFDIEIGDESLTKEPSVIEDIAYRDTWGRGTHSYISMLRERLSINSVSSWPLNGCLFIPCGFGGDSDFVKLELWMGCLRQRNLVNEIIGSGLDGPQRKRTIWADFRDNSSLL